MNHSRPNPLLALLFLLLIPYNSAIARPKTPSAVDMTSEQIDAPEEKQGATTTQSPASPESPKIQPPTNEQEQASLQESATSSPEEHVVPEPSKQDEQPPEQDALTIPPLPETPEEPAAIGQTPTTEPSTASAEQKSLIVKNIAQAWNKGTALCKQKLQQLLQTSSHRWLHMKSRLQRKNTHQIDEQTSENPPPEAPAKKESLWQWFQRNRQAFNKEITEAKEALKQRDAYGTFGFEKFNQTTGLEKDPLANLTEGFDPSEYFSQRTTIKDKPDQVNTTPNQDAEVSAAKEGGVPSTSITRKLTASIGISEKDLSSKGSLIGTILPLAWTMRPNFNKPKNPSLPQPTGQAAPLQIPKKTHHISIYKTPLILALSYIIGHCAAYDDIEIGLRKATLDEPLFLPIICTIITYEISRKLLNISLKKLLKSMLSKKKLLAGCILYGPAFYSLSKGLIGHPKKLLLKVKKQLAGNPSATGLKTGPTVPHEMRGQKYLVLDTEQHKISAGMLHALATGGIAGYNKIDNITGKDPIEKKIMKFMVGLYAGGLGTLSAVGPGGYTSLPRNYLLASDLAYLKPKTREALIQQAHGERIVKTIFLSVLAGFVAKNSMPVVRATRSACKIILSNLSTYSHVDKLAKAIGINGHAEIKLLRNIFDATSHNYPWCENDMRLVECYCRWVIRQSSLPETSKTNAYKLLPKIIENRFSTSDIRPYSAINITQYTLCLTDAYKALNYPQNSTNS